MDVCTWRCTFRCARAGLVEGMSVREASRVFDLAPFTIDLDSTICKTYGLAKEGARDHGYTGQRGYHPLLAVAAGTGDVLMAQAAEGSGQHRSGRRPLPAGDGGAGALRWGQQTTHGAG